MLSRDPFRRRALGIHDVVYARLDARASPSQPLQTWKRRHGEQSRAGSAPFVADSVQHATDLLAVQAVVHLWRKGNHVNKRPAVY